MTFMFTRPPRDQPEQEGRTARPSATSSVPEYAMSSRAAMHPSRRSFGPGGPAAYVQPSQAIRTRPSPGPTPRGHGFSVSATSSAAIRRPVGARRVDHSIARGRASLSCGRPSFTTVPRGRSTAPRPRLTPPTSGAPARRPPPPAPCDSRRAAGASRHILGGDTATTPATSGRPRGRRASTARHWPPGRTSCFLRPMRTPGPLPGPRPNVRPPRGPVTAPRALPREPAEDHPAGSGLEDRVDRDGHRLADVAPAPARRRPSSRRRGRRRPARLPCPPGGHGRASSRRQDDRPEGAGQLVDVQLGAPRAAPRPCSGCSRW